MAPINSLTTEFLSANTFNVNTVQLILNKPLIGPVDNSLSDFDITVDGNSISIENINLDISNNRIIYLDVDHDFMPSEIIKISY